MSRRTNLKLKMLGLNLLVILVSLYVVHLSSAWVAIQLLLINVPMLLVLLQEKDAKGRPVPVTRRKPGVLGSGIPYSRAGGKFALFFCIVAICLLNLVQLEGWWPHLGITTTAQEVVVLLSLCISMGYLLVYIYQRWPDEPRDGQEP